MAGALHEGVGDFEPDAAAIGKAVLADEAADLVCNAVIDRPKRVSTRLGVLGQAYAVAPKAVDVVLNTAYRLFPDSAAARGEQARGKEEVSAEAVAFAHIVPGVHW